MDEKHKVKHGAQPHTPPKERSPFGIPFAAFLIVLLLVGSSWGAEPQNVTLDAARVNYNDETGQASAEGGAVLTYGSSVIRGERIDYDVASQKAKAVSLPGGVVTLESQGRTMAGDTLEYDLETGEGLLTGARSSLPVGGGALYISGGGAQILPYEMAAERGLVKKNREGVAYVGIWDDTSATTCVEDHPHYHLETKRITFIPGHKLIASKPRLYLGKTYIFTYPADYVVQIDRRRQRHTIIPYFQQSERKGFGAGIGGGFNWDSGFLDLGFAYWGKDGFEGTIGIEQSIGSGFTIEGGLEYTWDKVWDDKILRPKAALRYENNGWQAALRWAQDEYVESRKTPEEIFEGRLDRRPELTVSTPWVNSPLSQHAQLRLSAELGDYQEKTPGSYINAARYGGALEVRGEVPISRAADFFWKSRYELWRYSESKAGESSFGGGFGQESVWGFAGLRYRFGALELGSGYERQSVWGDSPMNWDKLRDLQRLHQKIRFPIGKELFLAARGSYDLDYDMIDEVVYSLQWVTDCMKWELMYRDDRTITSNDTITLSLTLLAFPDTPASFGEYRDADPFVSWKK